MKRTALLSTLLLVALIIATFPHAARRAEADPSSAAEIARDVQRLRVQNGAAADSVVFDRAPDGSLRIMRNGAWNGGGATPQAAAIAFVQSHYLALGLRQADVALLQVAHVDRTDGATRVQLQQFVQGQAVLNGTIDVFVNAEGTVTRVNNHAVAIDGTIGSSDLTASQAASKAAGQWKDSLGGLTDKRGFVVVTPSGKAPQAKLVRARSGLWNTGTAVRGVHDIVLHYDGPDVNVQHIVDDGTGQVLKTRTLTASVDGSGDVFDPNPINFLPLVATGTLSQASPDADFTARMVNRSLREITTNGGGQFILTGPYIQIADVEPPNIAPPAVATANGFTFPRSDNGFNAVNAYRILDEDTRFIHDTLGFTNVMNYAIRVDVHGVNGEDNSHYSSDTPGTGYLAFGDGGVPDANDGDILLHEMGHAIQDNQSNGRYLNDGEAGAMGEGFSDFWAAARTYAQSVANGFNPALVGEWDATAYSSDDPPFLRRVDTSKTYPASVENEVHADGEIWSAALWTIYTGLADGQKNSFLRVVLQSHFLVPDAPTFKQGAQALLDANPQLAGVPDFRPAIRSSMLARGILVNKAPGNLKASNQTNGVGLTWDDNSDIESSYQVLRATGSGTASVIATLNPNTTSYSDSTTSGGTSYTYVVKAVNPDGGTSPTSQVSITTTAATTSGTDSSSSSSGGGGSSSGSTGGGGGGGGCFIATAAYGTPSEAHVVSLRAFRDHVLMQYAAGRWFVATYYRYSPPVADWIRERDWARAAVRLGLAPLVFGVENPALAGWALLLAVALGWRVVKRRRERSAQA